MIEKISYDRVTTIAQDMLSCSSKMQSILDTTKQNMTAVGTDEVWNSEAARELKSRFDTLSAKFESYYTAIQNYSKFLDDTVATYKAADAAISSASGDLLS